MRWNNAYKHITWHRACEHNMIIDHETDCDGYSGGEELEFAIDRLKRYYKEFPVADVIIGNHDLLIMRKAQTSAIPKKWIKNFKNVNNGPVIFFGN